MAEEVNGYKITSAEFRGRTLAHLEYIREDIKGIKKDLKTKACKTDVKDLRDQINNIKMASAIISGIGGLLAGMGAFFGLKKL